MIDAALVIPVYRSRDGELHIVMILRQPDVKLNDLLQPDAHSKRIERFPTWQQPQQVSSYQVGSHRLWGLSYRILHPVIPRLMEGEWDV